MKVVINTCFGVYGLSKKAYEFLGLPWDGYGYMYGAGRTDPKLIECVETLGKEANGVCANLKIVEIPDNVDWMMDDHDDRKRIHKTHRVWS